MPDRTERYLYRCPSNKLMMHLGLIDEAGDTVDFILDKGEQGLWLICRKANDDPRGTPYADAIREQTEAMNALSGRLRYIRDAVKAAEKRNRQAQP